MSQKKRLIIASLVASVLSLIVGVPGLLGAALIFPEGIEGDHGWMYLALATAINFVLFFTVAYYLIGLFSKPKLAN
jgi:Kef-type K+ transport system membrane component KefB